MVEVERAPQKSLLVEQSKIQQRTNAYGSIQTHWAIRQSRRSAERPLII